MWWIITTASGRQFEVFCSWNTLKKEVIPLGVDYRRLK